MAKLCVLPSLVFGLRYRAQHFLLQIFWASCLALQRKPLSNHCSVACANCTDSIHMSFSISSNKLALLHGPRRCARTVCSLIRGSSMPPHMLGACWNLAAHCHCRALGLIWTPITAFQDRPRSSKYRSVCAWLGGEGLLVPHVMSCHANTRHGQSAGSSDLQMLSFLQFQSN